MVMKMIRNLSTASQKRVENSMTLFLIEEALLKQRLVNLVGAKKS
jgi:hypothetical protein